MTASRRDNEAIFHAARDIPDPDRRREYVRKACGGDETRIAYVEALLAAADAPDSLLDRPAGSPAVVTINLPTAEGPGTQIGPYKLLEQIGEGGFGVVFMAEQQHPVRRKVALKVLKPGMDTRQVVARFEAERQALALMGHPNIAHVFDGGETASGRPFFVMELVRGIPITDFCDQNQSSIRERLELYVTVCQAVQHAHQKGIIHRDLKPSNVLVTLHDGQPVVKVIDFGIAKATGQQLTDKTLFTNFAQLIGTPLYMSPEQARMSGLDIDTRSDIYSLGVLLYELLTGTTPFDKERLQTAAYDEILRIIREEEPAKPSTRISSLGQAATGVSARRQSDPRRLTQLCRGELDWIVMKALEKDRNRRYESASAFAADVQRYLHDEPVQACPPSAAYRFRKFARRNKRAVVMASFGSVAAVALAVAAVAAFYNAKLQQSFEETDKARQTAEVQERRVSSALDEARFHQYFHYIARAYAGWREGNMVGVEHLLDLCPLDRRSWEWHYLKRLCHTDLLTLTGHTDAVRDVAYSPDGTRLASASADHTVKVWNALTGQEVLQPLIGHTDDVRSVAFSPDGKWLASASHDKTIRIWDATTGQLFRKLEGHTNFVRTVAFSPDGLRLVSGSYDYTVRVWEVATGREVPFSPLKGHTDIVLNVAYSPDGSMLASASRDVRVWDATTGQPVFRLIDFPSGVRSVAFSPDGRRLASGTREGNVMVWDVATAQLTRTLPGHAGSLISVAFSPDGRRLAASSQGGVIKVWDWNGASAQEPLTLKGHTGTVYVVTFSPDGTQLASASVDRTVKIWDARSEPEARALEGHTGEVNVVAFSPNGMSLASASRDRTVKLWDATTGQHTRTFIGHTGHVWSVAFNPDGQWLASASEDRTIRIWNAQTGQELLKLPEQEAAVRSVAFSPDGKWLASADHEKRVKLWKARTGQLVHELLGHQLFVFCVAFSPDGTRLASASQDRTVRLWDVTTGQLLRILEGHVYRFRIAFSPDASWLATATADHTIQLWNVSTGQLSRTFEGHMGQILGISFSPNGRRLASTSFDGKVKLWDVATGQEALLLRGHMSEANDVVFSPDGSRLATAGGEGKVKLWDARLWKPEAAIEREALGLLDSLFAKPLRQADVLDYLRNSPTIRPPARQLALSLVDRYREVTDPEKYHHACWALVRQPYLNAFQYGFGLQQARTACQLAPKQAKYRTTLGLAQYRLGRYPEALPTLTEAERTNADNPANLVFLAMTQHQLGHQEQARDTLARLREAMRKPQWTSKEESQAFLREAERLMDSKPSPARLLLGSGPCLGRE